MDARHHIDELQSLRGVAALMVAFSHVSSVYQLPSSVRITIDTIFNAHACIVVFFVLSGYVLTGSLLRRGLSLSSVKGFYVARLLRLFPALWFATALSALFLLLYPGLLIRPALSFWFSLYLHPFPSLREAALALLAIDKSLVMPVWTIFIELMGSAMMPLIVYIAQKRAGLFNWLLLGMAPVSYLLAYAPHRLDSLSCIFEFGLGAWLASRKRPFLAGVGLLTPFAAGLTLVFFRSAWFAVRIGHVIPLYFGYGDPFATLVEDMAAFVLVGALASERGRIRLLRTRLFVRLGDVSYSLYLIHFPVAILAAKMLSRVFTATTNPVTATGVLLTVTLSISLGLAYFMYRFVEVPSIALGKRLSKRLTLREEALRV